jgi:hypothetical protein
LPESNSPFTYDVFAKRDGLFHGQKVRFDGENMRFVSCDFYQRLRSPGELIAAMQLESALSARGVEWGSRPLQELAVQIFPSMYDAPGGVVPLPDPEESTVGDHIVWVTGIEDERVFFLNNWGPRWGDQGAGSFSMDYVNRFQREAWSWRQRPGPAPVGVPGSADLGPSDERQTQLREYRWDGNDDSPWELLHQGALVDVLGRWLVGVSDGSCWLQCVAILREAEGGPLIAGWIHLRGTSVGADIEELFVWPPYRRRGICTALASQALLYVAASTSRLELPVTWHELEADAVVRQRSLMKSGPPQWLREMHWETKPGTIAASQVTLGEILVHLAGLRALDGVRILRRTEGSQIVDMLTDDERSPRYGVVIPTLC